MKRTIEDDLRARIVAGVAARDAINAMLGEGLITSPKQAWRTLEKWEDRGEWEYGVNIDLGWFVVPAQESAR